MSLHLFCFCFLLLLFFFVFLVFFVFSFCCCCFFVFCCCCCFFVFLFFCFFVFLLFPKVCVSNFGFQNPEIFQLKSISCEKGGIITIIFFSGQNSRITRSDSIDGEPISNKIFIRNKNRCIYRDERRRSSSPSSSLQESPRMVPGRPQSVPERPRASQSVPRAPQSVYVNYQDIITSDPLKFAGKQCLTHFADPKKRFPRKKM